LKHKKKKRLALRGLDIASGEDVVTLDTLRKDHRARILEINKELPLRQRLMEMGLTPGTSVEVVRVAPLGDPIEVMFRGFRLSLRKHDAAHILCRRL